MNILNRILAKLTPVRTSRPVVSKPETKMQAMPANDSDIADSEREIRRAVDDKNLQALVRIMDEILDLYNSAQRTRPAIRNKITAFVKVCNAYANVADLVFYVGNDGEPFDPALHILQDVSQPAAENSVVFCTVKYGCTLHGAVIRKAIVTLRK